MGLQTSGLIDLKSIFLVASITLRWNRKLGAAEDNHPGKPSAEGESLASKVAKKRNTSAGTIGCHLRVGTWRTFKATEFSRLVPNLRTKTRRGEAVLKDTAAKRDLCWPPHMMPTRRQAYLHQRVYTTYWRRNSRRENTSNEWRIKNSSRTSTMLIRPR